MSFQHNYADDWIHDVKVLSFDLDDTLWDCAPVIQKAEHKLQLWFLLNTPNVVEHLNSETISNRRAAVVEQHPEFACDMSLLRHKMIENSLVDAGYSAELTDAAYDVFYAARSEVVLYEGCHHVLEQLGRRYHMAVITNGNADLSLIGLDDKFHHFQRASIDNAPKPHPHMFEQCLQAFDVAPSELAHIGDNVETDVGGGQRIGVRTVWFNQEQLLWPNKQPKADADVKSLQGLLDLFLPEHS